MNVTASPATAAPAPFRIEPVFSPRIWGSRSLAPLFPDKTRLSEPIGEAWLTGVDCRIAGGRFQGKSLRDAWRQMSSEWRGSRLASCEDFPLLVKFIFPAEKLSIQVHPDDAYAAVHEHAAGGRGKTEMWHAVWAEPGAQVLVGVKPGVDKDKFKAALQENAVEALFQAYPVRPRDTFFIPAGTPHTIGPGMILCEVQQYSDLTYRVYDYGRVDASGRPRELHIHKALDVMNFTDSVGGRTEALLLNPKPPKRSLLAACRYFAAEFWELTGNLRAQSEREHFDLLIVLSGRGELRWAAGSAKYRSGECWFVPAGMGQLDISPEESTTVLRAYVPELAALRSRLRSDGTSDSATSRTVFN